MAAAEEPQSKFAPDKKPWERLFNSGMILVSSSSRGNAFAVAYGRGLKPILVGRVASDLQCLFQSRLERVEHEGRLLDRWDVRPAPF